jgi:hypothetical protein
VRGLYNTVLKIYATISEGLTTVKRLDLVLVPIVGLSAFQLFYLWTQQGLWYLEAVAMSQIERPFVLRALIPLLSRELAHWTTLNLAYCLMIWVVLSSIGLYFAAKYLYQVFDQNPVNSSIVAFICCELFLFLMLQDPREYDFATAFFFTFSLALLARDKNSAYLLLFPIATLNRETTVLLSLFWAILSFQKMGFPKFMLQGAYQAIVYILIRVMIMRVFTYAPGPLLEWTFTDNVATFLKEPLKTSVLILLFAFGIYVVTHKWSEKPVFLRLVFLVVFPPLVALHLLVGLWWEVRVYAEIFPVLVMLAIWGILPALVVSRHQTALPS